MRPAAVPAVGDVIHDWTVRAEIGSGGMGFVVLATAADGESTVVVKFLHPALAGDAGGRARFLREVEILARVRHPNVVRVLHSGTWQDRPYLVMEHVNGTSLDVRRGLRLPWGEALRMLKGLASALGAVHRAGIIHRDVSPRNVLVRENDGTAVLVDFGLAQFAVDPVRDEPAAGTPACMAPEVVLGHAADARSDVWAAASTAYELLVGEAPHARVPRDQYLHALTQVDVSPSSRSNAAVPAWLDRVLCRALARSPEHRYADGDALFAALQDGEHVEATAPPTTLRPSASESPFVGRVEEIGEVASAASRAGSSGGIALHVRGPRGAGLSRFLAEAASVCAHRGLSVVRVECRGPEPAPYGPIRRAFAEHTAALRGLAGVDGAEALWWIASPSAAASPPPRPDLRRALALALGVLSEGAGVAVLVDDAARLDDPATELLSEALADASARSVVSLVGIVDDDAGKTDVAVRLNAWNRLRPDRVLRLRPLDERALAILAEVTLGVSDTAARRIARPLRARSGGNALHAVESLRLLGPERRDVDPAVREARLLERLAAMDTRAEIRETMRLRLARLSPDARAVLNAIAVDGAPTTVASVAIRLGMPAEAAAREVHRLVHDAVLREEAGGFLVAHEALRASVVQTASREDVAACASAAAAERIAAGAGAADPARLGRLLVAAGRAAEAAPYLVAGGEAALLAHSPVEALTLCDEAIAASSAPHDGDARVGRALALEMLGRLEDARAEFLRVLPYGGRVRVRASLWLATLERNRGEMAAVLERLAGFESLVETPDDGVTFHVLRAQAAFRLGRDEEARVAVDAAERHALAASALRRTWAASVRAMERWQARDHAAAEDHWHVSLALAETAGSLPDIATTLANLSMVNLERGRADRGAEFARRAVAAALRGGDERATAYARLGLADALLTQREFDEARRVLDALVPALDALRNAHASALHAVRRAQLAGSTASPATAAAAFAAARSACAKFPALLASIERFVPPAAASGTPDG